ncbi:prokaryotic cytochrome b561 family protein [Ehrlichia chaffeensis str. Heartland]|uniref:Cytochrome b561 family protein n=1 Tax=Ehrlichia chaffeensis (strain ATCC CRL-10679 / Arkansas) TaxID=205920 RepID=Q2GFM3_EHRCR|nr:cytochrome b [Ehrlichia chaffeensis]ABD45096.1 cytochrome b561 family protein [Ehrlichia chaffeensis str. Arkansas]AHX03992.1 prokaryotic cytochrome b561 family protein [Ehrlichia chaffeensis str. Heartland]AHX05275.1 prokaryotic cytochrome b561 family protein [Ehrlichia chaffeensis str. Jax]AHX06263.1 prokaryotic cytochrome b561 family protein [Ehrlichia chaffeensis str. Liberty]AHX07231.1 prokaryotic cytochrome b561 family protein [Ehrlichia chaffeensis str. Osceola]
MIEEKIGKKYQYHVSLRIMHWLTGIPIILMLIMGFCLKMEIFPSHYPIGQLYTIHKAIGMVLLFFLTLRIICRFNSITPSYPKSFSYFLTVVSKITHTSLYITAIGMATSGYVMSSASGRAIKIFSCNIPLLIDTNKHIANVAQQCHNICAYILSALIIVHILAALKHKFIDKDNVFNRII